MIALTSFLQWLITYAVSNGIIHFILVYLFVCMLTKFTTIITIAPRFSERLKNIFNRKNEEDLDEGY